MDSEVRMNKFVCSFDSKSRDLLSSMSFISKSREK